jgi:hypothetical protein
LGLNTIPDIFNIEHGVIDGSMQTGGQDVKVLGKEVRIYKKVKCIINKSNKNILLIYQRKCFKGLHFRYPRGEENNTWYMPLHIPLLNIDHATRNVSGILFLNLLIN